MRLFSAAVLAAALVAPAPARAQNREHQQIFADMRMLQEQVQRVQLAINALAEQVKDTNRRLDQQDTATRKEFADQQYRVGVIDQTLGTLRERLSDNTVRVAQLMQEMESVRQGIEILQGLLTQLIAQVAAATPVDPDAPIDPAAPPAGGTPPPAGGTAPPTVVTPPPVTARPPGGDSPPLPPSPTAAYSYAFGLYTSGDHTLAIEAFKDFVSKFPNSSDAPKAQYFMGESLYQLGRYKEAIQALQDVIAKYPESDKVPDAYFREGVCYQSLRQNDEARRIYRLIISRFPDSTAAINAATALKGIGGVAPDSQ